MIIFALSSEAALHCVVRYDKVKKQEEKIENKQRKE